jgi:pimeloyl-ACP methyl ester carboxylesterase
MFYSLLWARLKYWHGFNLVEFAYDWRVSIEDSAAELVSFLEEETSGPVSLVAHSMGGLVARAALPLLGGGETNGRLERVVQLATPNYGSFMPVLTLRGQNKWINQVLAIDGHNSLDDLISGVLSTFEGLCELMPAPSRFSAMDLFDRATWPADPAVDGAVLAKAKQVIDSLPQPDDRFVLIAGANQATVTSISRDPDSGEFVPCQTFEGDGTVPLALARFDASLNVPTYLANVTHSGIVADGKVADALNDLLTTDETKRLDVDTPAAARRRESPRPLDVRSARDPFQGRRGDALLPAEKHRALREVLGPLAPEGPHGDALAARAE